jgi:hypothetical protein
LGGKYANRSRDANAAVCHMLIPLKKTHSKKSEHLKGI